MYTPEPGEIEFSSEAEFREAHIVPGTTTFYEAIYINLITSRADFAERVIFHSTLSPGKSGG